jgi:hypothetical protein
MLSRRTGGVGPTPPHAALTSGYDLLAPNERVVLWLFADLIFRLNNFIETIGFLLSLALIAPGHPLVAGRQHLSFILLPGIESLLFFLVRERVIVDNMLRFIEVRLGVYNFILYLFRHRYLHCDSYMNAGYSAFEREPRHLAEDSDGSPEKKEIDDCERDNHANSAPDQHVTDIVPGHALSRFRCGLGDLVAMPFRHRTLVFI